jgi:preprotein translocase subunit SecE
MFKKVKRFLSDVVIELKKTTWPSKKDVIGITIVTCVMVAIVTAFLWVVDLALGRILNLVFRMTG